MKRKGQKENTTLNPKQKMFCQFYACDKECFGNATKAYMNAYGVDFSRIETAQRASSRLLRNVEIRREVDRLLDNQIRHEVVDRELIYLVLQNMDLQVKISAIREYNKVKSRTSDKLTGEFTFSWLGDDEKSWGNMSLKKKND